MLRIKGIIAIVFVFIYNYGFSQTYFGLQLGGTYPINYTSNELTRKFGVEPGFIYGKTINNNFSFETGLVVDMYGRINNEVVYQNTDAEGNYFDTTSNESFMRLSLQMPLLFKYKLSNDKVILYSGLNLAARNILTFSDYRGFDSETGNPSNSSNEYPATKTYGFDFDLGLEYYLKQNLILYLNFRTPILYYSNTDYDYGMISTGIKYHFGRNK